LPWSALNAVAFVLRRDSFLKTAVEKIVSERVEDYQLIFSYSLSGSNQFKARFLFITSLAK